jgi:hypothetical protein
LKLSVNIVAGGVYYKAGQELPAGFTVPPHLEAFAVQDEAAGRETAGAPDLVQAPPAPSPPQPRAANGKFGSKRGGAP